ncbi:MAG: hypothetical protein KF735_05650 [Chelatococcus sp.]|uniref:L,D-transpeptidase family protein n=1 Tax=Chelatococcus sp. TaxID=1953771 RepID=UPI0025C5AEF8|nr:L,D-transpeptidase family protein [Chelatococcus sp.]MBX3537095.1 hypothetical protein [Chelatococcus sp.]
MFKRVALIAVVGLGLASCQDGNGYNRSARANAPLPAATLALMSEKGMTKSSPILIRAYKKEAELEVWKKDNTGRYALLKTYPICRWSGQLGPKVREGDRQAPEGFYNITPAQMNPNSQFFLSFDTGFPNAYDRANGRTGSFLMVHGACSSRGCYSMTDEQIAEIYALGREAFGGGQRSFQFQAYPFRMTPENMAKHRKDPNIAFWQMLKRGSDNFEVTREEPKVGVCGRQYVFNAVSASGIRLDPVAACPTLREDEAVASAVKAKQHRDDAKVAELVRSGTSAVRLVYQDGGQHKSFSSASNGFGGSDGGVMMFAARSSARPLENVSRPEALMNGPEEIVLEEGVAPKAAQPVTAVASIAPTAKPAVADVVSTSSTVRDEATTPAPVLAAVGAGESVAPKKSLFQRVMSWADAPTKPAAPAAEAISQTVPAAAPLPPQRQQSSNSGKTTSTDKRAELPAKDANEASSRSVWPLSLF